MCRFGGVPEVVLLDHMQALISQHDLGRWCAAMVVLCWIIAARLHRDLVAG